VTSAAVGAVHSPRRERRVEPEQFLDQLMEETPALPSTAMLRKSDFERVGG